MKNGKVTHWSNFKEYDATLYFAQLLNEMLNDNTLDSYKPNALNIHSLIHEAISVSSKIKSKLIKEANFKHIRDELQLSLYKDLALKAVLKDQHKYYVKMISKSESHEELHQLLQSLHYYLSDKKYFDLLKEQIIKEVRSGKNKSNIFQLSRAFITEVLEYGYEKRYIHSLCRATFFDVTKKVGSINELVSFLDSFDFKIKEYQVIFKCSYRFANIRNTLADFGFMVEKDLSKYIDLNIEDRFSSNPYKKFIFIVQNNVKGLDHSSARVKSESHLKFAADIFSFYNHNIKFFIQSNVYVKEKDSGVCLKVSRPTDAIKMGKDLSNSHAAKKTNLLLNRMSLKDDECILRFTKAIQLHRLALDAKELENQLLDLWAAIETLIPKMPNSNRDRIIQISDTLTPYLSVNYVDKLLRELYKDLRSWNSVLIEGILNKINVRANKVEKLALMISSGEYAHLKDKLEDELKGYPLLINRIGIYAKWLTDTKQLSSLLERHNLKVTWQIRRIYRARNEIIHNGDRPNQLEILVENLHNYLDAMIKSISDMIIYSKAESISQSIVETKIRYEKHIEYLKVHQKDPITSTNFKKILFGKV